MTRGLALTMRVLALGCFLQALLWQFLALQAGISWSVCGARAAMGMVSYAAAVLLWLTPREGRTWFHGRGAP